MGNQPGYPLPSGELGEDEIVCQLVYLPNRPEYWQAFYAALHYMTTWRAWERDDDKRGKDAAANWRTAFELTSECWRMTCLEQLQDDVSAILAIMQLPADCCVDSDVSGGDQYTDRVTDGEGDVPQNIIDAGYADDAADWDGFDDYKCMVAHVLVDQIGPRLEGYLPWIDFGGKWLLTITIVAAFATVILATGGAVLALGIVATTGTITGLFWALFELGSVEDLIDNVSDNYEELVCAIYNADGDEGALIALNDKIDEIFTAPEALVLKNMNLGPTLKSLYAGRYDQQDIAEKLFDAGYELGDFTCDCAQVGEYSYLYDFLADGQDWNFTSGAFWNLGQGNPVGAMRFPEPGDALAYITAGNLRAKVGLSNPNDLVYVEIHRIIVDWAMSGTSYVSIDMYTQTDGPTNHETLEYSLQPTYLTREFIFDPPLKSYRIDRVLAFIKLVATSHHALVDNVYLDFDAGDDS